MWKQVLAVTIGVLLVLSFFSVLQFWQIKPVYALTFGKTDVGGTMEDYYKEYVYYCTYQSFGGGTISDIRAYAKTNSGSSYLKACLIDASGNKLMETTPATLTATASWVTMTLTSSAYVAAGNLSLGFSSAVDWHMWTDEASGVNLGWVTSDYPTMPSTFDVVGYTGWGQLSAYVTYSNTDANSPTYASVSSNSTVPNTVCNVSVTWSDGGGLDGGIVGTNNTGTWVNQTWADFGSVSSYKFNYTMTLNATAGNKVQWCQWVNDTSNNWNNTGLQTITLGGTTYPYYSSLTVSSQTVSTSCTFYVTWQDQQGLSFYTFGTNNTGHWVNETDTAFSTNPQTLSVTKTLNATVGAVIQYEWWANSTNNGLNNTGIQSFTTQAASSMWLHTSGDQVLDGNNNIVYLRGANRPSGWTSTTTGCWFEDGDWIYGDAYTHWSETGANQRLAQMQSYGFNVIRAIMFIDWWNDNATTNLDSQSCDANTIYTMDRIIQIAQNYSIYLQICPYASVASDASNRAMPFPTTEVPNQAAFVNFWLDVSARFNKYPNVIYELWNEPAPSTPSTWRNAVQATVHALRTAGDNHTIMVMEGYCGGPTDDGNWYSDALMYKDSTTGLNFTNMVYNEHIYRYPSGNTMPATTAYDDYSEVKNTLLNTWGYTYFLNDPRPIVISELGASTGVANQTSEMLYLNSTLQILNEWGFGYEVWCWDQSQGWDFQNFATDAPYLLNAAGRALQYYIAQGQAPAAVVVTITSPTVSTYTIGSVSVQYTSSGGNGIADDLWWNCKNGSAWIYGSNQTYTAPTYMNGFVSGSYVFYAWANDTDGTKGLSTIAFVVSLTIPPMPNEDYGSWWGGWW